MYLSPEFLKGESPLTRPSFTIIIRPGAENDMKQLPSSRQPDLLRPGAPVYVPSQGSEDLSRTGPTYRFVRRGGRLAWSTQQGNQSTSASRSSSKRRFPDDLNHGENIVGGQGGPGPQQVARANIRYSPYGHPTSRTRDYNPFSLQRVIERKDRSLQWKVPCQDPTLNRTSACTI